VMQSHPDGQRLWDRAYQQLETSRNPVFGRP
jgi:hypothetical protein